MYESLRWERYGMAGRWKNRLLKWGAASFLPASDGCDGVRRDSSLRRRLCAALALAAGAGLPVFAAAAVLEFSPASYRVGEGDGSVVLTVQLAADAADAGGCQVQGRVVLQGGSATGGQDLGTPSEDGFFTLDLDVGPNGTTDRVVTSEVSLPLIDDADVEGSEIANAGLELAFTRCDLPLRIGRPASVLIADNDQSPPPPPETLGLRAAPGATARGSFVVADERVPVEIAAQSGSVSPGVLNAPGVATYTRIVPAGAAVGDVLTDTVTLTNADGFTQSFPVEILVAADATPGIADQPGVSETQREIAAALDSACGALGSAERELSAGEQELLATCNALQSSSNPAAALQALAPDEVTSQGSILVETGFAQFRNIGARLAALRSGATGINLAGFNIRAGGERLSGRSLQDLWASALAPEEEADAADFGPWGIFVNGSVSLGENDGSALEPGYDFSTRGITAGVDYRWAEDLVLGVSLGYNRRDADLDAGLGGLDSDGYSLAVYATTYRDERGYLDFIAGYGWNDFETQRLVTIEEFAISQTADGDTDGDEFSLSVGGGLDFDRGAWNFGPFARVNYIRADIDGYTESAQNPQASGAGLLLEIDEQDVSSLSSVFGGQVSYALSTGFGVLLPQLRLEWEHEFEDDSRLINARFVNDPTATTFAVPTDNPDRNYFNLGAGLSAQFAQGRSGFLYYETTLGRKDIEEHSLALGMRLEF